MKNLTLILCLFISFQSFAQILSEREQAKIEDEILAERFNSVLPQLMDRSDIDMWVLISREYNEDPVLRTMLPGTWFSARRRTILVFYRDKAKNTIEKLAVSNNDVGESIKSAWDKKKFPNQWDALYDIIKTRNPKKIGINTSKYFGIVDGLVHTDYLEFMKNLPDKYKKNVVSAEKLAIGWIETRTEREMVIYNQLVDISHDIIAEAFSEKVITAGITTTDDVVWWIHTKIKDLGLKPWFQPSIDIQRSGVEQKSHIYSFTKRTKDQVILPGDLLHCDVGFTYLRLNTDCQEHAYVLKPNETEVPHFLVEAFKKGNRVQDIFTGNFDTGKTGNEIFLKSLKDAKAEGLKAAIYTHPLGYYGHSSGTTLGMWDQQEGVPGNWRLSFV